MTATEPDQILKKLNSMCQKKQTLHSYDVPNVI